MSSPMSNEELTRAKNAAFHFLKVRSRSQKEIQDKLQRKAFSHSVIEQTLQYLQNCHLINDREFARGWIQMRLRKPLGVRKIFFELKDKGIEENIIKDEIGNLMGSFNEVEAIAQVILKRKPRYVGLAESQMKRRLFDFLARRGFNLNAITQAITKL